jgi:predicted AAA+ superfamily ATPase
MIKRYLEGSVLADLAEKMVFIGGPRQVGKTTMAKDLAGRNFEAHDYLNWDDRGDRRRILEGMFPTNASLLIFDEIHKYRAWKRLLKGLFDKNRDRWKFLVTGSARLDVYRRGGDSLMGRYHYHRLHPFSVAEVEATRPVGLPFAPEPIAEIMLPDARPEFADAFQSLLAFGGFPEPFLRQSARTLRRWHNQRVERLVREDIRDVERVGDLSAIEQLIALLPPRVGSLFSLNSLREDLSIAHKTIANWMDVLERFYYCFRVYPFIGSKIRSLKKAPKVYLWDWSETPEEGGARLENLVAAHLLKFCHFLADTEGYKADLRFLRDLEGREVDFLVTEKGRPWFAVEVKSSAREASRTLRYFGDRIGIPFLLQVVADEGVDWIKDGIRIVSASRFLAALE